MDEWDKWGRVAEHDGGSGGGMGGGDSTMMLRYKQER